MDAAVLLMTVQWVLAAIFALALQHKLREPRRFTAAMGAYRLVPEGLLPWATWALVSTEALTCLGLLLLQAWSALASVLLLGLYALAIAINVLRGRLQIDCGCGDEPTPVSWALVMRNCGLILLAGWAWQLHGLQVLSTPPDGLAAGLALALALVAVGIYQAIEQLFANRGRHRRLWLGAQ